MSLFNRQGWALLLTAVVFLLIGAEAAAQTKNRINIGQLQKRGDIYYHPVTKAPYTGEVSTTDCSEWCDYSEIYTMKNGKFHGGYSWFDNEGGGATGNYNEGKKDGEWKFYDEGLTRIEYYKDDVKYNEWKVDVVLGEAGDIIFNGWKLFDGNGKPTAVNNTKYSAEDGNLYNKDKTVLIQYIGYDRESFTIPNSVISVEPGAFYGSEMGGMSGLKSLTIGAGIKDVKNISPIFSSPGCGNLASVEVAAGNANYRSENGVLFNKSKTTLIHYPAGKQDNSYKIPNSVTTIGKEAFSCSSSDSLKSVTIPKSVTSIEKDALNGTGGASIFILNATPPKLGGSINVNCLYVPQGSVDIYRKANYWKEINCINAIMEFDTLSGDAQKWDIGSSVMAIFSKGTLTIRGAGNMSYHKNPPWDGVKDSITNAVIMDGVTSIEEKAFHNCKNMTNISIPRSVTRIESGMFLGCAGLKNIKVADGSPRYCSADGVVLSKAKDTLFVFPPAKEGAYAVPNGVAVIGNNAFKNNKSIKSITIPKSTKSIGTDAFLGCGGLETIIIAADNPVYRFVDNMLLNKSTNSVIFCIGGIETVNIPDGVTAIGDAAFSGHSSLKSAILPNSVASIGKNAFNNSGITSIVFPDNLVSIGDFAFSGCKNLTSVKIKKPNPPQASAYTFYMLNAAACTLYVPQGSAYITTSGWNGFKHIGYMDSNGKVSQVVSSTAMSFAVEQSMREQAAKALQDIEQYKKQLADCGAQKNDQCALAMYMLGATYQQQALYTAGGAKPDYSLAMQTYRRFLSEYPTSAYFATAKQVLTQLEIMSLPPEQQQAAREQAAREQQAAQRQAIQQRFQPTIDQYTKQLAGCGTQKNDQCSVAMYMLGTVYYQMAAAGGGGGFYSMAIQLFQRLLNEYPASPYSPTVKQLLPQIEAMQKKGQ